MILNKIENIRFKTFKEKLEKGADLEIRDIKKYGWYIVKNGYKYIVKDLEYNTYKVLKDNKHFTCNNYKYIHTY